MRAYGNHTEIIIDRDRETRSHALLAERNLAPALLARFRNGLLYRFIPGRVCTAEDLAQERIWRGVAKRLGEWHSKLPIDSSSVRPVPQQQISETNGHIYTNGKHSNGVCMSRSSSMSSLQTDEHSDDAPATVWGIIEKWVDALPNHTDKQKARQQLLQAEVERSKKELHNENGIGTDGLVFGHCDLLCANVIVTAEAKSPTNTAEVSFIDYEYATPCPAAFDLANHFAEWVGYDCEYSKIPSTAVRMGFLEEYLRSFSQYSDLKVDETILKDLMAEVDRYRGMPGLYWGIWALIQATISEIDFDYASYAELRLSEYWAWRAESDGSRIREGKEMPVRERRWAQT